MIELVNSIQTMFVQLEEQLVSSHLHECNAFIEKTKFASVSLSATIYECLYRVLLPYQTNVTNYRDTIGSTHDL